MESMMYKPNLLELASKYAELKGTKIIPGAYSERENEIVFVVEAGHKRTMTRGKLENEIAEMEAAAADRIIANLQKSEKVDSATLEKKRIAEEKKRAKAEAKQKGFGQ
jgi:hypothetical protein